MRQLLSASSLAIALVASAVLVSCAEHAPRNVAEQPIPNCPDVTPGSRLEIVKNGPVVIDNCSVILESIPGAPPCDATVNECSGANEARSP